ncbi:rhamnan synthesis F family protein [Francisella adeliensis]|uniref:Uncharacterized protein n=1 Tax=Francisella adeliensis TaxID=2007306 RepID=A0A2Z4XXC0_9GAMM|nr:rhamnan synthesis F family protein [Francisella adeliensis]AXA33399.1 hypothetical protein CDH04_02755 [Francisella adeliensis]MBK2085415.1 hypothetical protein [Francisella adeliensis]MBK2097145.1 hypothetical protein [Francisella adeliensis]QIW11627.1 hypothetical protein FZC43_02755 [Francisella adeliensis]QIW13502.1 hypothetical protein FZC44_02755 [Francisella adeliensis]
MNNKLNKVVKDQSEYIAHLEHRLESITSSTLWKLTKPFRIIAKGCKKIYRNNRCLSGEAREAQTKKVSCEIKTINTLIYDHDFSYAQSITFSKPQGSICCIFAHYDTNNIIDEYVIAYLKSLKTIKNLYIIFVTTCIDISEYELNKLKCLVSSAIIRENVCSDFGSYKVGYDFIKKNSYSINTLIIANDSSYCISDDLETYFNGMQSKGYDAWGFTDSDNINYHLQSYFMVFNEKVIESIPFKYFWADLKNITDFRVLVQMYEVGLSVLLQLYGFNIGAFCSIKNISKWNVGTDLSLEEYDLLVQEYNYPFIKRKSLLANEKFINALRNPLIINHFDRVTELGKINENQK